MFRGRMLALGVWSILGALVAASTAAAAAPGGVWTPVAPPATARVVPAAAVLPDGKVLIVGGASSGATFEKTAEIYDPVSDSWSPTTSLLTSRGGATAVTLQSGKILVVGGGSNPGNAVATGVVYDPAARTWTDVSNVMHSAHAAEPMAELLPSGKVLIAGGGDATGTPVTAADLYDPDTNSFSAAGSMGTPRAQAAVAPLPGGKVLVAGGYDATLTPLNTAEVYDPASNTWTPVTNTMSDPRALLPGASALPSGKVLVMGGASTAATTASTDLYDPATNAFSPGPAMPTSRAVFGVASLPGGRTLVAGGEGLTAPSSPFITPASELYDPTTNTWSSTGPLPTAVAGAAAVTLPTGQVLMVGGSMETTISVPVGQAALFTPYTAPGAPLAVSASSGVGSALVSFAPPANNGGLPVLSYSITASSGQSVSTPDGRTAMTLTGLTPGRPVTFTVRAMTAFGTGVASAPSNAVTPLAPTPAPTPDHPAKVRIDALKTKLKLSAFLKGVGFTVTPDKPAALQIALIASVNRATIARALNLTLASARLPLSSRRRTVQLVPPKKLVGRPRSATVQLVIVATDAAGSQSTTSRTIHVSR